MNTQVFMAISESDYDSTEVKLFKKREDAENQIKLWLADEVIGLAEDKFKGNDDEGYNKMMMDLFNSLYIERNQSGQITWITTDTTVYHIDTQWIN